MSSNVTARAPGLLLRRVAVTSGGTGPLRRRSNVRLRALGRRSCVSIHSLPPDDLRDALLAEIPIHAPGVSPDSLDIDAIVDSLYDGHDGSLVSVPGDEPPEDPPE